jgi:hypothetical protein
MNACAELWRERPSLMPFDIPVRSFFISPHWVSFSSVVGLPSSAYGYCTPVILHLGAHRVWRVSVLKTVVTLRAEPAQT